MGWNSAIELGCPDEVGQVIVSTGIWIATLPGERYDKQGGGNAIGLAVLIAIPKCSADGLEDDASYAAGAKSTQSPVCLPVVGIYASLIAPFADPENERSGASREKGRKLITIATRDGPGGPPSYSIPFKRVHHDDTLGWRTRKMNRSSRRAITRGVEVFAQT
ncbi:hypothetical protein ACWGNA_18960 [Brucella cytisi]|uniref:hypothetical protein n=1 Tax=Brucella cytisi TaxID=407152 RepID=UPI0035D7171F